MPAARFYQGGGGPSVTFRRAPSQREGEVDVVQPLARAGGGAPVAGAPYVIVRPLHLRWRGMPRTDRDDLLAFFDAAGGMADTFMYRNTAGLYHLCRFGVPAIEETEYVKDYFEISLTLFLED